MNGFKTFSANALGGGIGAGVYTLVTSILIYGGFNPISLLIGMAVFGVTFGAVSAVHSRFGKPSLVSDLACGLVSVAAVGFLIMALTGFASAAGLLSPVAIAAMLVFSALVGTGGHLVKKAFASK